MTLYFDFDPDAIILNLEETTDIFLYELANDQYELINKFALPVSILEKLDYEELGNLIKNKLNLSNVKIKKCFDGEM